MKQTPWTTFHDAPAKVGEKPVWRPEEQALYWVDTYGKTLHRKTADGVLTVWEMPARIGTFAFYRDRHTILVALRTGIFEFEPGSGRFDLLAAAPYDMENYIFTDGRCDAAGRFWVGTARRFGSKEPDGGASWYRLDERGLVKVVDGSTVANGLAWSPDTRTMYVADRPNWRIVAFDYDIDSGEPSNPRTFATVPVGHHPDGAAVDEQGCYWSAMYRAGRIVRYRPDGVVDYELATPVSHPTMTAFGRADCRTLFVTSTTAGADRVAEPLAGAVFATEMEVRGLPEPRFSRLPPGV